MISRPQASPAIRPLGRRLSRSVGRRTAGVRMLPDFLLVGAQRAGTTSLHRALASHPAVVTPLFHKGVHYFDVEYARGLPWYQGHFPVRALSRARTRGTRDGPRTFESSGYYMHHPHAALRIQRDLPGVQLVVMLRDPVERAYSAHRHEFARGFECEKSFERALELEGERLDGQVAKMLADPSYVSFSHRHHSYVDRGQYVEQIGRLFDMFDRSRVHVLDSEAFFEHPHREFDRLLAFLGLSAWTPPSFDQHNAAPRERLHATTRDRLNKHFAPYDDALTQLLGRPLSWRSRTR
ncbi:MAG: sulfotransferase domain-containing protein [Nocardioidaceae bacterium]